MGMSELATHNPTAQPEVYVDDTAMLAYGKAEETLIHMMNAVLEFVATAKQLTLQLCTKGVIVAEMKKDSKQISTCIEN